MWKYLLFLLVLFLATVSCNLLALGVQIYCDFWLMGISGSSPSISLRLFLWRVSQAYLRPMNGLVATASITCGDVSHRSGTPGDFDLCLRPLPKNANAAYRLNGEWGMGIR